MVSDMMGWRIGGARRDRTADLLHAMQALSHLSYSPFIRALWIRTLFVYPSDAHLRIRVMAFCLPFRCPLAHPGLATALSFCASGCPHSNRAFFLRFRLPT